MLIYLITNKINNKKYVGQTTKTMQIRFRRHCWKSEIRKNMPISLAIAKYGKENFTIEEICRCSSQTELNEKEIYYTNYYNSFSPNGYNLKAGAGIGSMSEETKNKIRIANTGKKFSDETKRKLSESHKGHKVLESTKQKLSTLNKGKKPSKNATDASSKYCAKLYFVISPVGEILIIYNMKLFCQKYGLTRSGMCKMYKNTITNHKQYCKFNGILDFNI